MITIGGTLPAMAQPAGSVPAEDKHPSILADLPLDVRDALAEQGVGPGFSADPRSALEAVFRTSTPYAFGGGAIVAHTDQRWFATFPEEGEGAPLMELRRWPGDSVLALYAVRGTPEEGSDDRPPVEGASFADPSAAGDGERMWVGQLRTVEGERPAVWLEREVGPAAAARLGALLLPGDAGFGAEGIASLQHELLAVAARVEVREALWKGKDPLPAGGSVILPRTLGTPGLKSEEGEPWQVIRATGFTIGLPPGFRARRMDGSVPPPHPLPGGALWIRGRCVDWEGTRVAVGDALRFGYVARVAPATEPWSSSRQPPLAAPTAERIAREPFPLAEERTRADQATAERWREPGFDGEWLVFRLHFADHGFEIVLPVLSGRTSPSLYWLPATWRDDSRAPAPPPVDPAERFGIEFERLTRAERQKRPWVEGVLSVPGMSAEVSLGWLPAASLRSEDGYPVRIVDYEGNTIGSLHRVAPDELETALARLGQGVESDKPGRHRAAKVIHDASGTHLFLAVEGHGFRFERAADTEPQAQDEIRELWDLMMRSVRLQAP